MTEAAHQDVHRFDLNAAERVEVRRVIGRVENAVDEKSKIRFKNSESAKSNM